MPVSFNFPGFVQFFPTMDCNKACTYCFNRGYKTGRTMSGSNCRRLIEVISDAGVREIDVLGGEPTLYPDLADLIDIAVRRNIKIFLSSNGSNVELLTRLAGSYGTDDLAIGISLHEVVPKDLHEFITRFRPLLKSVCPEKAELPAVAKEYVESGMEYRLLYRDAVLQSDVAGTVPFHEYLMQLNLLKNLYRNIEGVFCGGFISMEGSSVPEHVRCPAGTVKVTILPDGSVFPCYLLIRSKEFKLGNIITEDFRTIMNSPVLTYFREFRRNNCPDTTCRLHASCRGGCPAVSLLLRGDLDAPDPRCVRE